MTTPRALRVNRSTCPEATSTRGHLVWLGPVGLPAGHHLRHAGRQRCLYRQQRHQHPLRGNGNSTFHQSAGSDLIDCTGGNSVYYAKGAASSYQGGWENTSTGQTYLKSGEDWLFTENGKTIELVNVPSVYFDGVRIHLLGQQPNSDRFLGVDRIRRQGRNRRRSNGCGNVGRRESAIAASVDAR